MLHGFQGELFVALENGAPDALLKKMVEFLPGLFCKADSFSWTILHHIAAHNLKDWARRIAPLVNEPALQNNPGKNSTIFFRSAVRRYIQKYGLVEDLGADDRGNTVLHLLTKPNAPTDLIETQINQATSAQLNSVNNRGQTPFTRALNSKNWELALPK